MHSGGIPARPSEVVVELGDVQAVKIVLVRGTRVGRLTAGVFSLGGHQYHPPLTPLSGYDCEQVPEPGLPPPTLAMKRVGAEQTVRGWC